MSGDKSRSGSSSPRPDALEQAADSLRLDPPLLSDAARMSDAERTWHARRSRKLGKVLGLESLDAVACSAQGSIARPAIGNDYDGDDVSPTLHAMSAFAEIPQRDAADTGLQLRRQRSSSFSGTSDIISPQGVSHGIFPRQGASVSVSAAEGPASPAARQRRAVGAFRDPAGRTVAMQSKAAALFGLEAVGSTFTAATTGRSHSRSFSAIPSNSSASIAPIARTIPRANTLTREERIRKMDKLSRWLGAVVPPEMIASGKLEQPGSSSPGISQKSTLKGMLRRSTADEAAMAKLLQEEIGLSADLSARERFERVQKAGKLEKLFGERVPPALIATSQSRRLNPVVEGESAEESMEAPNKFRHSLSSIEFLLENDAELLERIAAAVDDDEDPEALQNEQRRRENMHAAKVASAQKLGRFFGENLNVSNKPPARAGAVRTAIQRLLDLIDSSMTDDDTLNNNERETLYRSSSKIRSHEKDGL